MSVFDQRVGSAVATFEGHTGAIYDVDFDADVAVSCGQVCFCAGVCGVGGCAGSFVWVPVSRSGG